MGKNKFREITFVFIMILSTLFLVLNFIDDSLLIEKDRNLYYLKKFFVDLLGWNFMFLPVFFVFLSIYLIKEGERNFWIHLISSISIFLGLVLLFPDPLSKTNLIALSFRNFFGEIFSFFIILIMIFIPLFYIFDISLPDILETKIPNFLNFLLQKLLKIIGFSFKTSFFVLDKTGERIIKIFTKDKKVIKIEKNENEKRVDNVKQENDVKNNKKEEIKQKKRKLYLEIEISQDDLEKNSLCKIDNYYIPSPFFLQSFVSSIYPRPKSSSTKDYSEILEETLKNFGIQSKVIDVQVGPSITRYELQVEKGVKVSQILRLKNDIALALAAIAVRIEAPIPGKSAIGIEIPNEKPIPVYLSDILTSDEFLKTTYEIPLALGKDISGNIVICDLTKTPHLLIAGATGSGKTVCINSIICSMLFKFSPTNLQLLLIDPKMVELILYEGIPHIIDIVTDVKKAPNALLQMVKLMEDRYKLFSSRKVRNIQEYNSLEDVEKLPYIVIVIDELADLMMTSSNAVEGHIARLTQLARAAGIHLIIATQRPSANVITGVIKANIPSRIAFAVASQIDSRVILDISGAENLIGRGDMLYMPIGSTRPMRAQGCFVGLKEIELIVKYWQMQPKPDNITVIDLETPMNLNFEETEEDPELLKQAAKIILEDKKASTTMLQRKMRIGFAKAGRIMDILEKMNIVGPQEGSKPRKILIQSIEDIERIFGKK